MQTYLDLMQDIYTQGLVKSDRTGVGTRSVFGRQIRHDLRTGFPLLTTKKLHFKSIVCELLWFLSGDTNVKTLQAQGVNIWNEWATETGDLGPIYGKQWTAWPTADGEHLNQIDAVVHALKHNPESRRILFHGWNPADLPDEGLSPQENVKRGKMALPPCHLLYQFYVAEGHLSAQLYLRSSDTFLGLPYNIASLALLTHMLAQQTDLIAHEIILTTGDSHLYLNHDAQVQKQLTRTPKPLPELKILRRPESLYDYRFEDFAILGYDPHPHIAAPIAV
ncbi:thymidylate synthase [Allopseudospirillum japonicum]|uniref:Thymidylate synthase n=1 Tax=Allopseudospirillum japonicum TaxID=64971 RepID=A0A1H6T3L4_9GAMM|nr:thymidylate synthase [Allopseudospirillum japonicum]SEI70392.1 thymidylate synthase [Allopseudospirillum japonicum]